MQCRRRLEDDFKIGITRLDRNHRRKAHNMPRQHMTSDFITKPCRALNIYRRTNI